MAATEATVKAITGSTLDDAVVTPFLTTAGVLVAQAAERGGITDATVMDTAQEQLAAHLLVTSKVGQGSAPLKSQKIEEVYAVQYQGGSAGDGVLSTTFGQTADALLGGNLATLGSPPVGFYSVGAHGSVDDY